MKARIKFRKYGALRFIGHLDVMRFFQKVMRRADIPIAFTTGSGCFFRWIQSPYDHVFCQSAWHRTDQRRRIF